MKSIKRKLTLSYLVIIIITVLLAEVGLISLLQKYYYSNAKEILVNEIELSSNFYNTYLSNESLEKNIANDVDIFWKNTNAEVQILDINGNILMDSIGFFPASAIKTKDFSSALMNELGYNIEISEQTNEKLMSVAYPLKSNTEIVGVLRFVTSLRKIDATISRISYYLFGLGLLIIFVSAIVSIFIASTITKPLSIITKGAENLAKGNYNEEIEKISEDELGKLTDTLNIMSKEILKNAKLKDEFIASVSHELRTPLTSIKGWAITLEYIAPKDSDDFKEGLKIIENETDRLSTLVEDLLDFSKLSSGKITLSKTKTDLNYFLEEFIKKIKPRILNLDINLTTNFESNLPFINIDQNRLTQTILNVLDNSFNFTLPGDYIYIKTKIKNNFIFITIEDTGSGISSKDLPHITQKFYKGKNSNSKNGIGLSICKEIMNLHNGDLFIESTEGKGTIVKLSLPLQ
ncbi:sensor histidine kinase [Clostridium grantii]|uniref:histidine kinase n=1 Tax=Clostridium grantii DSM 8605 TaxID=1121316 RepID=A0A1M5XI98_9CLOT|nr:ATP-binding protein [Clostridium grantii]SHH99479.1 Signal transduction histidine kinase [Clostridium grantii DSM 8605]